MARKKGDKTKRAAGRPKASGETKKPHLVVRGKRNGMVGLNIRNGGAAAKIFMLKADDTFDRVVPAEEYAAVLRDENIAPSKRGLSKSMSGYLARGAIIRADQKEQVVKEVGDNFKALRKMIESGELKAAGKVKTEIIMLG